ncbi:MAG: tRNA (adenosine(37)-N6)-threonylcarbamoyltransferase complex dimerization subunit type 1 TsaB [Bacteroidia bacterium]|jgi:tRNA threonylcarbamoyladenosine biosynthesis protein TsaB
MGLILNIETATTVCSVSLAKDGLLLALKEQDGDYSHAENLTLFIEHVVKEAGVKLSDIDAVAISKGPGSYTGLRIGVSAAKGLCYALNKPLIAVDTLQYLSLSVSRVDARVGLFCPMFDARRMEVYCAIYDSLNNLIRPTAAEIIDENSFSDLLDKNTVFFFGNGAEKCMSMFSKNKNAVFIKDIVPSAEGMIALSENSYKLGQFENVAYFEPFYLKDFIAGKKKKEVL